MEDQLGSTILSCNQVAMSYYRLRRTRPSQQLLHRAFALLPLVNNSSKREKLKFMTLTNLGCLYSSSKPEIALKHLEQALGLKLTAEEFAGTYLNLSAIRSSMGQHHEALRFALMAVQLLSAESRQRTGACDTALAVAYHNVGLEYELLEKFREAENAYCEGLETAKKTLGVQHHITRLLKKHLKALQNSQSKSRAVTPRPSTPAFPLLSQSPQLTHTQKHSVSPLPKSRKGPFLSKFTPRSSPTLNIQPRFGRRESEGKVFPHSSHSHLNELESKASNAIHLLEQYKQQVKQEGQFSIPSSTKWMEHRNRRFRSVIREESRIVGMQAVLRGYLARCAHRRYVRSCVTIQRYVRGHQVATLYRNIRSAVVCIQRAWRRFSAHKPQCGQ